MKTLIVLTSLLISINTFATIIDLEAGSTVTILATETTRVSCLGDSQTSSSDLKKDCKVVPRNGRFSDGTICSVNYTNGGCAELIRYGVTVEKNTYTNIVKAADFCDKIFTN